ncbi:MAG: hypothetical protein ACRDBG_26455 [Waterburya sp.]
MITFRVAYGSLMFVKFEREKAIALLAQGQAIIPMWLETIHQKLHKS